MSESNPIPESLKVKFGQLRVIGAPSLQSPRGGKARLYVLCECDCGTRKEIGVQELKQGDTTSCGCFARKQSSGRFKTHGHSVNRKSSKTYEAWRSMRKRCYLPKAKGYERYGGRGITVCERWRNSFEAFLADMGEAPANASLDRFPDQNGNYEPGNCRWATAVQQQRNMGSNRLLEFGGRTQCLAAWAEELGFKREIIRERLRRGWSVERALTTRPLIDRSNDKRRGKE
jgi:hypothetical protein